MAILSKINTIELVFTDREECKATLSKYENDGYILKKWINHYSVANKCEVFGFIVEKSII